ncbi:hypothetical protein [Roseibium marinum]|uniref:Uncharacterized protein n=1 Tax=Roseibium marinum TaxID=281252 RepID=A0A2S3UPS2_9HYPH|nr:hypothetical protein [Roseibium marinum]POF29674.1 hypothetical protein CLV41_10898 [Roseibium marinum]
MESSIQDTAVTKNEVAERDGDTPAYEPPKVKSLAQGDLLSAVKKGSKFPARGFSG